MSFTRYLDDKPLLSRPVSPTIHNKYKSQVIDLVCFDVSFFNLLIGNHYKNPTTSPLPPLRNCDVSVIKDRLSRRGHPGQM